MFYSAFGLTLSSTIPLPELPERGPGPHALSIRKTARRVSETGWRWFQARPKRKKGTWVAVASRRGSYRLVPFPPERKRIDIGDFHADTTKIRGALGWAPRVPLRDGLAQTIEYYLKNREHYL